MEWMLMPYRRYAEFSGRSRRKEYWLFTLLLLIVYSIFGALILSAVPWGSIGHPPLPGALPFTPGPLLFVGGALFVIFALASFIPSIAVQVRRFHDQDRSGWLVLLGFIPYVGGLIVLVMMCLEGTRGPNRYGDDPLDPGAAEIFR